MRSVEAAINKDPNRRALAQTFDEDSGAGIIDFEEWLRAPYAPLPSLVNAARRLFQDKPLPHVADPERRDAAT